LKEKALLQKDHDFIRSKIDEIENGHREDEAKLVETVAIKHELIDAITSILGLAMDGLRNKYPNKESESISSINAHAVMAYAKSIITKHTNDNRND
jgi:hypothetical protein